MTLPVLAAFLLLALGASETIWVYWLMIVGGWYLSKLVWWHMYRYYVLDKQPPRRNLFFVNCTLAQTLICIGVVFYAIYGNHG